ncbi:MAG: glycosyltransferase family 4 protein, partial [Gemmatimonadota bacterium]|nr:glycosyltransferase family 4 protein [Gemmatimonadota bacterium]
GFLFPAGDAGALADAMRRLCGSEELRASMAEGARARVRSEAPHVAAGRLVELLRAALAGERIQDL